MYTPCTKIRLQKNEAGILYTAIFRVYKIRVLLFYAPNFVHGHFLRVQNPGPCWDFCTRCFSMCTKFRYIPGFCTRPWTQCCVAVYDLGFRLPSGTCSRDRIGFCPAPPLPISHSSRILLHAPILCPSPSPGAQPDTPVQMSAAADTAADSFQSMTTLRLILAKIR